MDAATKFNIGDYVIYRGKTYTFPGEICGITDDGQYIVRAFGAPDGSYKGMKHIYGAGQLEAYERPVLALDPETLEAAAGYHDKQAEGYRTNKPLPGEDDYEFQIRFHECCAPQIRAMKGSQQ